MVVLALLVPNMDLFDLYPVFLVIFVMTCGKFILHKLLLSMLLNIIQILYHIAFLVLYIVWKNQDFANSTYPIYSVVLYLISEPLCLIMLCV